MIGLEVFGLEMIGLEMIGVEMIWLEMISSLLNVILVMIIIKVMIKKREFTSVRREVILKIGTLDKSILLSKRVQRTAQYCQTSFGSILTFVLPNQKWSILYHTNSNIGGASKIYQICYLELMAIAAEGS